MITDAQYQALGPLAREIIDFDQRSRADADVIAANPVLDIRVGTYLREQRAERARLSAAAGMLCNRPTTRGGGPPKAAAAR